MPDLLFSSWVSIATKIRRLTRNPSEAQLSSVSIVAYINDFILYDMPAHVKLDSLQTIFTFYTNPHQAEYETIIGPTNTGDTFYHFKDYYNNVSAPIYIGGEKSLFTQSMQEFYDLYPKKEQRITVATGDGVTTTFTGTISSVPILKGFVYASSTKVNGERLLMKDDGNGAFTGDVGGVCSIDYNTGAYVLNFNSAPKNQEPVLFNYVPYTAAKPDAMLFFNDKITLRPVPDAVYEVNITVRRRPHEVLSVTPGSIVPNLMPELSEWWQYIAFGAAKKILQDRLDFDTLAQLEPEFKQQEILINRRKIMQNSRKRAQTIFSSTFENGS